MSQHLNEATLAAFAALDGEARRLAREHLAGCAACRFRLVGDDPARIFSLLGGMPVPRPVLDEVSRRVTAAVADRSAGSGVTRATRWRTVGVLAASLLLATLVGLPLVGPPTSRRASGPVPSVEFEAAAPRAAVDLVEPAAGAQVFDLTVGDTQVVMIFDEGLEL